MTMGQRIAAILQKRGLKPADLARQSGVKEGRLSQIINGVTKHPRGDTISKLAKALNVSEGWLLTGEGEAREDEVGYKVVEVHQKIRLDQEEWLEAYDQLDPGLRLELLAVVKAIAQGEKPPGNLQQLIPQDIAEAWLTATDEGRRGARLVLQASAEQSRAKRSGGSD